MNASSRSNNGGTDNSDSSNSDSSSSDSPNSGTEPQGSSPASGLDRRVQRHRRAYYRYLGMLEGEPDPPLDDPPLDDPPLDDPAPSDPPLSDRTPSDRTPSDRTLSDRTPSDRTLSDRTLSDRTLSGEVWKQLRAPFDRSDVVFDDVQVDGSLRRGVCRPKIYENALIHRLNRVLGPEGWSADFDYEGPGTYRCRLRIGSTHRDAVAQAETPFKACIDAMRRAMAFYGMGLGLHGPPNIYVEKTSGRVTNADEIIERLQNNGAVKTKGESSESTSSEGESTGDGSPS